MKKYLLALAVVLLGGCKGQSTYDGPELRRLKNDTAYARKYNEAWDQFIAEHLPKTWVTQKKSDTLYYKWIRHDTIMLYNNEDTFLLTYPIRTIKK